MPGPVWMRTRYPELKWTQAYTANAAIGQGYVLASPLQMAMAYAAVANGGVAYEPRLIQKVERPDGQPALDGEWPGLPPPKNPRSVAICARKVSKSSSTSSGMACGRWSMKLAAPVARGVSRALPLQARRAAPNPPTAARMK